MRHLILLSGKAQAGKNTFASAIAHLGFKRYAFADALKREALQGGWDGEKNEKGRILLQNLGSAWRHYEPDHWIRRLQESIEHYRVVVTDCRYINEISIMEKWGKDHGFRVHVVRIERPGHAFLSGSAASHPSECELDDYLFMNYVWNVVSKDDYCSICAEMVRGYLLDGIYE